MDTVSAYHKVRSAKSQLRPLLRGVRSKFQEEVLVRTSAARKRNRQRMWEADFDAVPIALEKEAASEVMGCYFVSGDVRYSCERGRPRLVCLDLLSFKRWERVIDQGEKIRMQPYVAHVFLVDSLDDGKKLIRKTRGSAWSYSHEIYPASEYSGVPDDFRIDRVKMRMAESMIRFRAIRHCDEDLNHETLIPVLETYRSLTYELSEMENSLSLGMAFDWLRRLSSGRYRPRVAAGAYRRIHSAKGGSYHDVRATEIGENGGPIVYPTHIEHFRGQEAIPLPNIDIGRNVLIGSDTFIEVGAGLSIGEYSWIVAEVNLLKHEHRADQGGQLSRSVDSTTFFPTRIMNHAMVGHGAHILPKTVYIGKGSAVGAWATVGRSVGDYAVVAGNPARVISYNVKLAESMEKDSGTDPAAPRGVVPYDLVAEKVPVGAEAIIVGASDREDIISAARIFKHVTAIDCCEAGVLGLIKRLSELKTYNVCIQSGKDSLIYEVANRKALVIWQAKNHLPLSEKDLSSVIDHCARGLLIEKNTSLFDIFFQSSSVEYQVGNGPFYFFSADAARSKTVREDCRSGDAKIEGISFLPSIEATF